MSSEPSNLTGTVSNFWWITDTKIHQFNQTLLHKPEITDRNLNPDEEVSDECFTHPSYPLHYPDDPLTVEQFLTLPEMVDVSIVFEKIKVIRRLSILKSKALNEGTIFHVVPKAECPHLDQVRPSPDVPWGAKSPCLDCQERSLNYICLTCYQVRQ